MEAERNGSVGSDPLEDGAQRVDRRDRVLLRPQDQIAELPAVLRDRRGRIDADDLHADRLHGDAVAEGAEAHDLGGVLRRVHGLRVEAHALLVRFALRLHGMLGHQLAAVIDAEPRLPDGRVAHADGGEVQAPGTRGRILLALQLDGAERGLGGTRHEGEVAALGLQRPERDGAAQHGPDDGEDQDGAQDAIHRRRVGWVTAICEVLRLPRRVGASV